METLEERLADMLAEEYKRHAQALASAAASQTDNSDFKNSELWNALTSYIAERMDYLDAELEKKLSRYTAPNDRSDDGSGEKKTLEERFQILEKQYRKSRKSTIAIGSCFFASLAAIAVSLGSGMSFQQIISVIIGG